MPFYEFSCEECGIFFEIGATKTISTSEVFCVDCGATKVKVVHYNKDINNRVTNLANKFLDLGERVAKLEDSLFVEEDSDDRLKHHAGKEKLQ